MRTLHLDAHLNLKKMERAGTITFAVLAHLLVLVGLSHAERAHWGCAS